MSLHTTWKLIALTAALVAAVTWLIAGHQAAEAGHTHGDSHCRSLLPSCVYIYSPDGLNLIDDQKSFAIHDWRLADGWTGEYEEALDEAEFNWAKAVGPQAPMEPNSQFLPSIPNDYYNCVTQGDDPGGLCGIAAGYVCWNILPDDLSCYPFDALNVTGSETYITPDLLDEFVHAQKVYLFAHELGHTLRLAHHFGAFCVMSDLTYVTGPQDGWECDLGFADPFNSPKLAPCDRDSDMWGIRCIYWWWREQRPSQDCYDVDRSGAVTISDIFLAGSAFPSTAGEPGYHPDADVDRDGVVNINDIFDVAGQFPAVCGPPDHYEHS